MSWMASKVERRRTEKAQNSETSNSKVDLAKGGGGKGLFL